MSELSEALWWQAPLVPRLRFNATFRSLQGAVCDDPKDLRDVAGGLVLVLSTAPTFAISADISTLLALSWRR